MASWLVRSTSERAVRVRALAGDIVLCSWARHFTLTVPLSTQVYKWVPVSLMLGGNPAMDYPASHPGGSRNIPSHATETGISSVLVGHIGPYADFTFNLEYGQPGFATFGAYSKDFCYNAPRPRCIN